MPQYSRLTSISYLMAPVQIIVCHLGSLLVLLTGLSSGSIIWMVWLYLIRMLATTGIYHRLLTHRAYRSPVLVLWIGSLVAASAGQLGPSCWKAHHLVHHQNTDQLLDPHSPYMPAQGRGGFYWSQVGWLLSRQLFPATLPLDVEKDPVLRGIDRLHFIPLIALGAFSYWM
ncbi:MAG: fatty acid desaturase, partial [Thermosynechococcaceae cyanobacterium]